jgi:flagellar biosynthesis/type III secretory pathway protein FliH
MKIPHRVIGFVPLNLSADNPEPEDQLIIVERQISASNRRIKELEEEIQKTREESYQLGFQDGLATEREQHSKNLEAHRQRLQNLAVDLGNKVDQTLVLLEEPLLDMSFNIARKLIGVELDEEILGRNIIENVKTCVQQVLHADSVAVRLAPDDVALFQTADLGDQLDHPDVSVFRFIPDQTLQRGECVIQTPEHLIDGRYEHQLKQLQEQLR